MVKRWHIKCGFFVSTFVVMTVTGLLTVSSSIQVFFIRKRIGANHFNIIGEDQKLLYITCVLRFFDNFLNSIINLMFFNLTHVMHNYWDELFKENV
jgi:hypothetical protein